MKKLLALILAVLMVLSLVACGGKDDAGDADKDTGADTGSDTADGNADSGDDAGNDAENGDTGFEDVSATENDIGFFSSGVDVDSRDTYEIAWMYMRPMALFQNITTALEELESVLNFKVTDYCANSDIDAMIQNIELYASKEIDGIMIVVDPTASTRIVEVLDETGVPYVAMLNSVRDENGSEIVPCVGIEGYVAGSETIQWLYDNHQTYWGEIDTSKIGLLNFNYSPNVDFADRNAGAKDKFLELVPNGQVFEADGVSGALDEQTGYDLAAATLAANPDVEYWFVAGCIELYSQGAARAVESLNMEDRVLITAVGSDILPAEWESGYDGCFVSCLALSNYQYAVPGICALVAMMDGKIDADTLWSSRRADGDQVTFYTVAYGILTKDNYEDFFAKVKEDAGLGA